MREKTILWNHAPKLVSDKISDQSFKTVLAVDSFLEINEQNYTAPHGHFALYCNILCGLHRCYEGDVYLCEHDVLYPQDWCDYDIPAGKISYHQNGYFYKPGHGFAVRVGYPLSTLAGDRDLLIDVFKKKMHELLAVGRVKWAEPRADAFDVVYRKGTPFIDIRHGGNFTGDRNLNFTKKAPRGWEDYCFE